MNTVPRRLELLKLEGLGFSRPEVVKELVQKYGCHRRTVYRDYGDITASPFSPSQRVNSCLSRSRVQVGTAGR